VPDARADALASLDGGDRLSDATPPIDAAATQVLFDAFSGTDRWRMAGRGSFAEVEGTLVAMPGGDLGLYWCTVPTPPDFVLTLEWRRAAADDNSGVFIRFPDPTTRGYDNQAWVGVHFGLEVQIDELARPDGADDHRTGAIYDEPMQAFTRRVARPVGEWNQFEIHARGQDYAVWLNGELVTTYVFGGDPAHPGRAQPTTADDPRYIGLQAHTGQVAFRNIQIRPF
jgi:hypothetical protein